MARLALAGTGGVLAFLALPSRAQVIDPTPTAPPPLPDPAAKPAQTANPTQNALPMPNQPTPNQPTPTPEGELLTRLVPVAAGYTLSETQTKEVAAQLQDYPGGFAKARAFALSDAVGPAFAAVAPVRKERVK